MCLERYICRVNSYSELKHQRAHTCDLPNCLPKALYQFTVSIMYVSTYSLILTIWANIFTILPSRRWNGHLTVLIFIFLRVELTTSRVYIFLWTTFSYPCEWWLKIILAFLNQRNSSVIKSQLYCPSLKEKNCWDQVKYNRVFLPNLWK